MDEINILEKDFYQSLTKLDQCILDNILEEESLDYEFSNDLNIKMEKMVKENNNIFYKLKKLIKAMYK